jgi:CRP/FNR family transcriptional regulator, cyclic AMP receptor protein
MLKQDYTRLAIFADLDSNQISQLSPYMVECRFPSDMVVFEQGQPAEFLYILTTGEVMIRYKPYDGPPLTVARIIPGGVFGWSAALRRDIYTSDAIALLESTALRFRGSSLQIICDKHPETGKILLERLAGVIAERLRSTHTQVLGMLTQGMETEVNCSKRSTQNDRK